MRSPSKLDNARTLRADGLIGVTRGSRTWWALVECKIGDQDLNADQMEAYLDLARVVGIDAVLSISNQYQTRSSEYPVAIDRKKLRKVNLYHWSWVRVLTEAEVQKQFRGVKDRDQAYILGELIRYLSDPRSGVVLFDDMGASWTSVRDGARVRTLRKSDPPVAAVASRWDELLRYLGLDLTKELGRDVRHVLGRDESAPGLRPQLLRESLVKTGRLYGTLQIPDAAGTLSITADLAARQIVLSTEIDAPKEGQSRGRISWLLRQLQQSPADVTVEARLSRTSATLSAQLGVLREDPALLQPDRSREIRNFRLAWVRDMGGNRAVGRGSFITSVVDGSKDFYREVLQNLTAWKPRAPRLREAKVIEPSPEAVVPEQIEEGLERARVEHAEPLQNP